MSGESPAKTGRGYARNLEAGPFQPMIDSWDLHLRAERKSAKTIRTYLEAAQWLASGYLIPAGLTDWDEVKARHVQEWIITLLGRYSDCYANNQFRALQQFFKWHATEDPDEPRPNPMVGLKPPKIGDKLVPVFTDDELAALLGACKGGGFQNRRDYAIISLFKDTGARLSELAGLTTDDIVPREREAVVTGKGDKQRTIKYTYDTARALDRYQRERARHKMARVNALWLGVRGGPMTPSGVYQVIERRGLEVGVEVNPHKFRHTFSHVFLDRGGAEGDLMELNGWSSPQMLARYGRSARSARARRHYDASWGRDAMTGIDKAIRWSTAAAVIGVAVVAAVVSYEHAYDLVRAHGETGWTAHLIPLTVDGLIWASSMVMLDSARRDARVPSLARWLLAMGIVATLAANVAHGLGHGAIGAAVAAWPAMALVGSYELLMMIMRGAQRDALPETEEGSAGVPGALQARAAEEFADDMAGGHMPSIRVIRARLHVGQPRAQLVRAYLAALADG